MLGVRSKALLKVSGGVCSAALVYWILVHQQQPSGTSSSRRFAAGLVALPSLFALMGVIELIAGCPFGQVAARWETISFGRRMLLSLFIILLVLAVSGGTLVFFAIQAG